jgi:hypothetical protein
MLPCSGIWVVAVSGVGWVDLLHDRSWDCPAAWAGRDVKDLAGSFAQSSFRDCLNLVRHRVFTSFVVGWCARDFAVSWLVVNPFDSGFGNGRDWRLRAR